MMTDSQTVDAYISFIQAHYLKDMSTMAIANELDITQGQVRQLALEANRNYFKIGVGVRRAVKEDAYAGPDSQEQR